VVSAVLSVIASVLDVLGRMADRSKQARQRLAARGRGRPVAPRTNVRIQPDRRFCIWSQMDAPPGQPGKVLLGHESPIMTAPLRRRRQRPGGRGGHGTRCAL